MSKIGEANLVIEEIKENLDIVTPTYELDPAEKKAIREDLRKTIEDNSCEEGCPHKLALGLLS